MKRIQHLLILALVSISLFASCKKEKTEPESGNGMYDPVNVLNDNSGYEQLWDTTTAYGSLASISGYYVRDFTVDTRNRMHFVYHYREEHFRRSLDLSTRKVIPQHPDAAKEETLFGLDINGNYHREVELFKPYTNYYVGVFQSERSSFGFSTIYFKGDIQGSGELVHQFGRTELGFENVVVADFGNNANMYIGLNKKNDEDFNYRNNNTTVEKARPFPQSENLFYILCDARTSGKSLYIGLQNSSQLKAIEFDRNVSNTTGTLTATLNWTPPAGHAFTTAFSHYSADGTKLSFALLNYRTDPIRITTFSYNFTTKEFKKVVDHASLSYGREGSSEYLYDLDDEANLYYAGYAENGTNDKGVSIYKISAGNTTSLVGKDNFLKFGRVAKLKYLHGKLYLAVTGTKPGTNVNQLSFIRQK